jgi:L-amino acid N-acyltransferase YncA
MEDLKIISTTPENIHQFGMCGYKNTKNEGYRKKLDWTRKCFEDGMRYKMLVSDEKGAIGGIEYLPGEHAWRPVEASGYFFIHCIFIMKKDAKGLGYGQKMVESCIEDASKTGMKGVAVITRKGSWMAGKDVFVKMGFEVVDKAKPDFELLAFRFDENDTYPKFVEGMVEKLKDYQSGLYIFTSGQCPYAHKATTEITEAAEQDFNIKPQIIHLETDKQAREVPFPFGSFGMCSTARWWPTIR